MLNALPALVLRKAFTSHVVLKICSFIAANSQYVFQTMTFRANRFDRAAATSVWLRSELNISELIFVLHQVSQAGRHQS
jgi:hypothetical protein